MERVEEERRRLSGLRVGLVQVVPDQDAFDAEMATCAAQAVTRLEDHGAHVEWLSNTQQIEAPESLDAFVLFLHRPAGDRFLRKHRSEVGEGLQRFEVGDGLELVESVVASAVRLIVNYRNVRPNRLPQYQRKAVRAEQANVVQLCGPRGLLLDPATQERCRGTGLIYHYTNGGEVPDLGGIYRERVAPAGLSAPRHQTQEVLEDAHLTLQRWGLGNPEKAEHVYVLINHLVREMEENNRRDAVRRPVPGDERNSLQLVVDGYECPPDMINRVNVLGTIARGVRQTREAIASSLGWEKFGTPTGGRGTDTQKFRDLYWALHTFFSTRGKNAS